jgi:hypothetical protein
LVVENGKYSPVRAQEIVNKAEAGDPTAQQQKAVLDEALRYGTLPAIRVFLFGAQFLYYRARGGYTTVDIGGH